MSNSSRIACSLAPAYFHHWRSNARISRSRSDSSTGSAVRPDRAPAALIGSPARLVTRAVTLRCAVTLSYNSVILARAGDEIAATPPDRGRSGIEAAGPVCLGDPADADHLRRGAQRDALVGGQRGDLGVGAVHDRPQPVI